jgi:hypothetical protein
MEMPVKSKVAEISLRPYEFLLPVYEAVVNAIISITNNKSLKNTGLIQVSIKREEAIGLFDKSQMVDKNGNVLPTPISEINIVDNGSGFNDKNFSSFSTAYSPLYKDQGCKGVGRFTMLACFDEVIIDSIYAGNDQQWRRNFSFDVEKEIFPKNGGAILNTVKAPIMTSVTLKSYKPNFKTRSAIPSIEIAAAIIDHCLLYFLAKNPPTVVLNDSMSNNQIVLNDILKDVIQFDGKDSKVDPINNGTNFKIKVIRRSDGNMNRLKLCANNRVVGKTKNLGAIAPEFEQPMEDKNGNAYYIDVYVISDYFDNNVNTVRNSFNIAENNETGLFSSDISIKQIEDAVLKDLLHRYKNVINKFEEQTLERVRRFILDPKKLKIKYRSLLSRPDLLKKIPFNATNDKIEEHLIRIKIQLEKELTISLKQVLRRTKPEDFSEYSQIVSKYLDQEAKFAKDKLADLVIHRKGVIDLIKRLLKLSKDGKYSMEQDFHNVIFPMGADSDTLPYEYHNLWLLDERLAFHSFVGSDKKLKKNPYVALQSNKEADILVFDFPWAFSEKEQVLSSMVVFEFKRPGREFTAEGEKKFDDLIMKYFEDLMDNKARDNNGELLNLEDTTPKFGYIICDIDKGLSEYNIKFNQFRKTPNGTFYKINEQLNLHLEAMTYQQMLLMSEKRHFAFFKELGLDED